MFLEINKNKYCFINWEQKYKFIFWWKLKKYMKDFNLNIDDYIKFFDESFYLSEEEQVYFYL